MKLFLNFLLIIVAPPFLFYSTCWGASASEVKYGANDNVSENAILRINKLSELRVKGNFYLVEKNLISDLDKYSKSVYAKKRILNELSDIYSYQLMDIEKAIEFDNILATDLENNDVDDGKFFPKNKVANQKFIINNGYFNEYVGISDSKLKEFSLERLKSNKRLLLGSSYIFNESFDVEFIKNQLEVIKSDVENALKNTSTRNTLYSRLIMAEYALAISDKNYKIQESGLVKSGELSLNNIDFQEINFLEFANYLILSYKESGDIYFAELALDTVYKPYVNLRNPNYRWQYNKLINDYISILINANFEAKRYDEMLYYVSLNKSRMLLEERLAFAGSKNTNQKISELTATDGIPRTSYGLPEKKWFMQQLAKTDNYLDFYVGGKYVVASATSAKNNLDKSSMPLNSRNIGLKESQVAQVENFEDDALIVAEVKQGKVTAKKIAGNELAKIKNDLEQTYQSISNSEGNVSVNQNSFLTQFNHQQKLTVSPDKWISKHPLDFHLGTQITRSVNFFTTGNVNQIKQLNVAGFFNPTLDLAGAEQEAAVIQSFVPDAQLVKREAANLSALKSATNASVIHLSMHGAFNSEDPKNSKLFFAGAKKIVEEIGDPNALYASEMGQYKALQDRDLIFAAACQTGLSKADTANQNELMGIVRPLTANRNKNIILSLWNVSDAATKDFVAAFYQKLANTKDVEASFHYAQNEIKTKYKSPYYWAAFYLSQSR